MKPSTKLIIILILLIITGVILFRFRAINTKNYFRFNVTESKVDENPITLTKSQINNKKSAEFTMVLDADFETIRDENSNARKEFEDEFVKSLSKALGILPNRIQIISIVSGSIVVKFRIIRSMSSEFSEIVNEIARQSTDKNSILRTSNITNNLIGNLSMTLVEDMFDCSGILFGKTEFDSCGVCDGDNLCVDDNCFNTKTEKSMIDLCGECLGTNDCVDCAGVLNGTSVIDECGVCGGLNASCLDEDCNFLGDGTSRIDKCGVCMGLNSCVDCAGVVNGTAVADQCGECGGTNSCIDCAGVVNGTAVRDANGICGMIVIPPPIKPRRRGEPDDDLPESRESRESPREDCYNNDSCYNKDSCYTDDCYNDDCDTD